MHKVCKVTDIEMLIAKSSLTHVEPVGLFALLSTIICVNNQILLKQIEGPHRQNGVTFSRFYPGHCSSHTAKAVGSGDSRDQN